MLHKHNIRLIPIQNIPRERFPLILSVMTRIGRGIMISLFNYINGDIVNLVIVEFNNGEYLIKIIN